MTAYKSRNQIFVELEQILPEQIDICKECEAVPPALEKLIAHNFNAKFVCYDKDSQTVEVGVEKQESITSYPEIEVMKFPLKDGISWLKEACGSDERDLKFYAKVIAENGSVNHVDDVVLV